MEYPIENEDDRVFRDKYNLEIVISNNGPVNAILFTHHPSPGTILEEVASYEDKEIIWLT